jgi:hemolysin-activating ACP:hemolysin acyltransferase
MSFAARRLADTGAALGAAAAFVAARPPFDQFPAGALLRTLRGQVRRGHYLLLLKGPRLCAYAGWGMVTEAEEAALLRQGLVPGGSLTAGDRVWIQILAATDGPALRALIRALRAEHRGRRAFGLRHRPGAPPRILRGRG